MKLLYSLFILTFSLLSFNAFSTHLTLGEINAKHISGNDYLITFKQLVDCSSIGAPTYMPALFTCGTNSFTDTLFQVAYIDGIGINNSCDSMIINSTCNGGSFPNYHYFIFRDTVNIPTCGNWSISFSNCCRYPNVNINSSTSANTYIEMHLDNALDPTNSSPYFPLTPNLFINAVDSFRIDYSAIDIDGDSLVYSFAPIKTAVNTYAIYNPGYSASNPIDGFAIDPNTGVITKTADTTTTGAYYLAVMVKEYDPVSGVLLGEVQKELTVLISNFYSTPSTMATAPTPNGIQTITGATMVSSNTYATCVGSPISIDLSFSGSQQVTLWSDLELAIPNATYTVVEGSTSVLSASIPTSNLAPGNYTFYVQAIEDTCFQVFSSMSYEAFTIIVNGINAGQDQTICLGDSVQLTAAGSSNYSNYQWTAINGPTMNSSNSSCTSCANPMVQPTATTTYLVTGTGGTTCGNSDTITVFVDTPVNFNIIGNANICSGDSITLDASASAGPYYWIAGNYSVPFSNDSIVNVTPIQNTTYYLFGDSNSMCTSYDSIDVFVHQNTIASNDIDICEGSSTTLTVTGGSMYSWTPSNSLSCGTCSTTIASPLTTTTYVVTSSNTYCNNVDSVTVTVHNNTVASNDTVICEGDSVMLNATGGTTFNWIPSFGLSCSNCPNPMASPSMNMTYYVTSNTNAICSAVDTINIIVEHDRIIYGTAYQSSGLTLPSTNIYMITYNPLDSTVTAIDSVLTSVNGEYSFTTTESLVYLKITPDSATYPSLIPTYYNGQGLFLNSNSITANACDSIIANITALQGFNPGGSGFISGNVYQGAGKTYGVGDPVANLNLLLVNDQNQVVAHWLTSDQGTLQFSDLPFGTYKIWVDNLTVDNSLAPTIKVDQYSSNITYNFNLKSTVLERTSPNSIIDIANEDNIQVYPNPARDWIKININEAFSYEITNLNGAVVLSTSNLSTDNKINITNLTSGVYIIEIKTKGHSVYRRIVKE